MRLDLDFLGAKCDSGHRQMADGDLEGDAELSSRTDDFGDRCFYGFTEKSHSTREYDGKERYDSQQDSYSGENVCIERNDSKSIVCDISQHPIPCSRLNRHARARRHGKNYVYVGKNVKEIYTTKYFTSSSSITCNL